MCELRTYFTRRKKQICKRTNKKKLEMNVRRWNATEIGLYVLEAQIPYQRFGSTNTISYQQQKKRTKQNNHPKNVRNIFVGDISIRKLCEICVWCMAFFYGHKNVSLCRHTKLPTKQIMSTINMFNNVVWNEVPGPSTRRCLAYLHFANLVDSVEQKKKNTTELRHFVMLSFWLFP